MAPNNRMTAYQNARAAEKPQKGLTYSELLLDNLIGFDNEYASTGEQLGQAFRDDPLGFLKNAGVSAYEGTKNAVLHPITTAEELLSGLYDSGANVLSTLGPEPAYLDNALQEMYGVSYDEATDEQVNRAREALFGDVLNVGSVATSLGAASRGIAGIAAARDAEWRDTLSEWAARDAARDAEWAARDAARDAARAAARDARMAQLDAERIPPEAEPDIEFVIDDPGTNFDIDPPAAAVDHLDRLPSLLERAQRREPLTEEEAFDVMTYERFGEDGVYDPTNNFASWLDLGGDTEAAARIAFLTDPTNPQGMAEPVAREPGPYFADIPPDVIEIPDAPFLDVADIDEGPDIDGEDYAPSYYDPSYEVRPTVGQQEGIAGLYSPTRRAVDLLDRPSYDNLDSLRVQLINRGAKPDELERLVAKIPGGGPNNPQSKADLARLADEASQDVVVSTRTEKNSPRDSAYLSGFFLKGAEDMGSNVFELSTQAPIAAFKHFKPSEKGRAPVLHTRFGMFRSPGADKPDTYHLGEIQSDWAQMRQKLLPTRADFEAAKERYLEADNRLMDLVSQRRQMKKNWEQTYGALSPSGGDSRFSNTPNIYKDAEYQSLEKAVEEAQKDVGALENKISSTTRYGPRDEFDAKHPAPYVGTTSKWVQLGLRQSLLDAVNKGAKRMTLSTGEQVRGYTYGEKSGQNKFYDVIVPKELDEVLRKFAKEAGIRKPEITTSKIVGSRGQEYMVPTVEFTDEFVEALKRVGLPAYAKGGIVKGSYLDNDPFEPALY